MSNLEVIEKLINDKEYDKLKKFCYRYMRQHKRKLIERFMIANMLSKYDETKELSKIILQTLLNSDNKEYALSKLINLYIQEGSFQNIIDLCENYLEFIKEGSTLILLSKLEKNLENYDIAYKHLSKALYLDDIDDLEYLYELILLEIKIGNYDSAYDILTKNECMKYHKRYKFLLHYILSKLNIESFSDTYWEKQTQNYDEKFAKKYIKKHRVTEKASLCKGLDTSSLFNVCKKRIQNLKPVYSDFLDRYIIEFDYNIGYVDGKITNYAIVSTFLNEKDILMISPTNLFLQNENVYKLDDSISLKYASETRIEKFNRKYPNI